MNLSYRRDKDHNYMVIDAPQKIQGTEYQMRMILENSIDHLLKCHMRMMDGRAVFFYEITGMQPVFRIYDKTLMNQEDIQNVLLGIKKVLENMESYLLNADELLLEPEYMFMDAQTREIYMCYLPSYEGNIAENFRRLTEYILKKLDHSDEQAVMLGYAVYSRTAEENYRISEALQAVFQFQEKKQNVSLNKEEESEPWEEESEEVYCDREYTQREFSEAKKRELDTSPQQKPFGSDYKEAEWNPPVKNRKKPIFIVVMLTGCLGATAGLISMHILNIVQAGGILFFAAAAVLYFGTAGKQKMEDADENHLGEPFIKAGRKHFEEEDMTCILSEDTEAGKAALISKKPEYYESVILDKPEMRVGKENRSADICISCNVVSRVHAKIFEDGGSYYLEDLTSTNGTYINGRRLPANEIMKLESGDLITFGVVDYYFKKTDDLSAEEMYNISMREKSQKNNKTNRRKQNSDK